MARHEEIADAVVFLDSPHGSFISGSNLIVDETVTTREQGLRQRLDNTRQISDENRQGNIPRSCESWINQSTS